MTDEPNQTESTGVGSSELSGLISRLEGELAESSGVNATSRKVGTALVVIIGLYLCWVTMQVNRMSDPEELALAAAGAALEATPVLGNHLRSVVVDGAPDIARLASTSVIDMIPAYRQVAEAELTPLIDEVSSVLAQTAVSRMALSLEGDGETPTSEQEALQAAADAALGRLETVLEEAMDEPMEDDGPSPRQTIEASLSQLRVIDRGLRRVARKGGDPQERELILSWLSLIAQQTDVAEASAREEYRVASQRAAGAEAAAEAEAEAAAEAEAPADAEAPAEAAAEAEAPAAAPAAEQAEPEAPAAE
jgi:hypothetical protein